MIPSYFNSQERIAALEIEGRSWVGTPFVENSAAKGRDGGVSCHFLAAAIYRETGALPKDFVAPRGTARGLKRGPALAMIDFVDASLGDRFDPVESGPQAGDMIVIAEDERAKHVGVVLTGRRFVHVLRHVGVRISTMDDSTYSDVVAIRRPKP
jgi:cell wall-associated NlpC family hydrolase